MLELIVNPDSFLYVVIDLSFLRQVMIYFLIKQIEVVFIIKITLSALCGGVKESRTPDLLRARQALYQLSYNPIWWV